MSNEEIVINLTNSHKEIIQRLRAGGKLFFDNVPPGSFHTVPNWKTYDRKSTNKLIKEYGLIEFKDNSKNGYVLTELGKNLKL